ncbi:MAG: sugar transferase [Desulfobacterales bacterium]
MASRLKRYDRVKRSFDIALGIPMLGLFSFPMTLIAFGIKGSSPGPVIHWSFRVGAGNRIFRMPKFRTMRSDTPAVATHLLKNPEVYVTGIGKFLRKTSLDELPQLFSVLQGRMAFVGPRPALFNQDDLIGLRTSRGVHTLKPGITGWAQINGRDELPIPVKVSYDEFYLKNRSMSFDLRIILLTLAKTFRGEGVTH